LGEYKLKYPDSLVALWKYVNRVDDSVSEVEAQEVWQALEKALEPRARDIARKFGQAEAQDLVSEFLADLVGRRSCPVEIAHVGILVSQAKKLWTEKYNRSGKDVSDALSEVLRKFVRDGVLLEQPLPASRSSEPAYCLADSPSAIPADLATCLDACKSLPMVGTLHRSEKTRKRRAVTPTEAGQVVLGVLRMLGGDCCVAWRDLLACVLDRARDIVSPYAEELKDGQDVADDAAPPVGVNTTRGGYHMEDFQPVSEGFDLKREANDFGWTNARMRFQLKQLDDLAQKASERIWSRVEKLKADQVFCLYTLPTRMELKNRRTLAQTGLATSTAKARHDRVSDIMDDELRHVVDTPGEFVFADLNVFSRTMKNLFGRCTGKGYDMPAYAECKRVDEEE